MARRQFEHILRAAGAMAHHLIKDSAVEALAGNLATNIKNVVRQNRLIAIARKG